MLRHQAEPSFTGLRQRASRVQSPRHGLGDDGAALLRKRLDKAVLLRDERVDGGRLAVEEVADGALPVGWRNGHHELAPEVGSETPRSMSGLFNHRQKDRSQGSKLVRQEPR